LKVKYLFLFPLAVRDAGKMPDKFRLSNYGESLRRAVVAGISLAVHTTNAQIHLESPALEMQDERSIITNDRFTASFAR
jgi:hypothetical protein